ncbi:hypothetical protein ID866_8330 [Astraeus odoratus]|nr:hypothetical protein ID866_8330 [Astraeus odoratus]
MDELAEARAVLAVLENRERELLLPLLDVHAAKAAQKSKIDKLIRARPSSINRLPTELLVKIIYLSIDYPRNSSIQKLAGVSRRWREVILGTPCFWTTITVPQSDHNMLSIEAQLARSCKAPLDVILEWNPDEGNLGPTHRHQLDLIVSCANRWRSLKCHKKNTSDPVADIVVRAFKHLEFPLLRYIDLKYFDTRIIVLFSANAPALEHLVFHGYFPLDKVLPATWFTRLKTLMLHAHGFQFLPVPIHAQSLTRLSLIGNLYFKRTVSSVLC